MGVFGGNRRDARLTPAPGDAFQRSRDGAWTPDQADREHGVDRDGDVSGLRPDPTHVYSPKRSVHRPERSVYRDDTNGGWHPYWFRAPPPANPARHTNGVRTKVAIVPHPAGQR